MGHIRIGILLVFFMLANARVFAQQDPLYTQYMFNMQVVNPAYTGTWESLGFTVVSRNQWVGIDLAPTTNSFSVQAPVRGEKVGLGLSLLSDKIGYVNRFAVFADYSYKLRVTENNTFLRLGLKGGFSNYSNNLSAYNIQDPDPAFEGLIDEQFMPNFGVGLFLYNKHYYFGASVPKVVQNKAGNSVHSGYKVQSDIRHWFFMGGYVFELNEAIKFKPSFMAKMVRNTPFQVDFNANFLLKDKFWFGAMYRTGSGFGGNLQWIFNRKLRIGYAIDYSTTGLYRNSKGIHELMVSYEMNFLKNVFQSPRYY